MNHASSILKIFLLLTTISASISCTQSNIEVVKKSSSPAKPNIDGFYFFEINTSIDQIEDLLKSKGINFKRLAYNSDEIIAPGGFYIHELIKTNRIQLLKISDFNLLGYTLDQIQVGFYNSKILYLEFLELNGSGDNFPVGWYPRAKVFPENAVGLLEARAQENLNLMGDLKEGLEQKYGPPSKRVGDIYNSFEYLRPYDMPKGTVHTMDENIHGMVSWDSPATRMEISLFRSYQIKLESNQRYFELFLESVSVIFDMETADKLYKEAQLQAEEETKLREFKEDSLKKMKRMQYDSL